MNCKTVKSYLNDTLHKKVLNHFAKLFKEKLIYKCFQDDIH